MSRRRKAPAGFDYQRYLASREWAVRKRAVRERAQGCCERCLLLPLAATHHLTYEHIGAEPLEDLQGVCKPCHAFESGLSDFDLLAWAERVMVTGGTSLGNYGLISEQERERHCRILRDAPDELVAAIGADAGEEVVTGLRAALRVVAGPVGGPVQFFYDPAVNLHLGVLRAARLARENAP